MAESKEKEIGDIHVLVGGVINSRDIPKLGEMGIVGVLRGGTSCDKIPQYITGLY